MPRLETVTTPPTLGAGRRMSYTWPRSGVSAVNGDPSGSQQIGPRPFAVPTQNNNFTVTVTGAPPAPRGLQITQSRVAWAMTSNAGTGYTCVPNFGGINRPLIMPFQETQTPNVSFEGVDDFWCWSFSAIMAFDAIPGAITGDIGIAIGCGTRAQIRGAAQFAGMEFGPTGPGTIGVICRQADAGAVTFAQNVAGVTDMTTFHKYEIRIIGPTKAAQAKAKFMIDGNVQLTLDWGPGTVLPSQRTVVPGNIGFTPGVINLSANAATSRLWLPLDGATVCAGPTEAALP